MRVKQFVSITFLLARLRAALKRGEGRHTAWHNASRNWAGCREKGVGWGRTTGGMGMWLTSPRALHAAHVSLLTTSAAKAPAPGTHACCQAE